MENLFFIYEEGENRNPDYIFDNSGKSFMVVSHLTPSLYLIRFEKDGKFRDTFFQADYNPSLEDTTLISGKMWEKDFPAHSFLTYGSNFSIIENEPNNNEVNYSLFDLDKQEIVDNSTISDSDIKKLEIPLSEYNQNALISLLSKSEYLLDFINRYGAPEDKEQKDILFSLFNRVVNAETKKTFSKMKDIMFNENKEEKTGGTLGE